MLPEVLNQEYSHILSQQYSDTVNSERADMQRGEQFWQLYTSDFTEYIKRFSAFGDNFIHDLRNTKHLLLPYSLGVGFPDDFKSLQKVVGITALYDTRVDNFVRQGIAKGEIFTHRARSIIHGDLADTEVWQTARVINPSGFDMVINFPAGPYMYPSFMKYGDKVQWGEKIIKEHVYELEFFRRLLVNLQITMGDNSVAYSQIPYNPFESRGKRVFLENLARYMRRKGIDFIYDFGDDPRIDGIFSMRLNPRSAGISDINLMEFIPESSFNIIMCDMCPFVGHACRYFGVSSQSELESISRDPKSGAEFSDSTTRISSNPDGPLRTKTTARFDPKSGQLLKVDCKTLSGKVVGIYEP